jgi:hypothetical protein
MALNRELPKSSSTFVKYSDQYEEVLKRALKAKSSSTLLEIPGLGRKDQDYLRSKGRVEISC